MISACGTPRPDGCPAASLRGPAALHTCTHIRGAANEIATVFVRTLEQAIIKAPANVVAGLT